MILQKNEISYVDWIELIRFKETRNYVQRVLENVNVYKYMINQQPVKMEGFETILAEEERFELGTILLVRLVSNQLV